MAQAASSSHRPFSAHVLIANVGGLFGVGVFLYRAATAAALENVLLTAVTAGLATYLTLAVGFAAARHIVFQASTVDDSDADPDVSPEQSPDDNDDQNTPEPQAA